VDAGRTKHIGISNHSIQKVKELLEHTRIKPAVNQVEVHPYWCAFGSANLILYKVGLSRDSRSAPMVLGDSLIWSVFCCWFPLSAYSTACRFAGKMQQRVAPHGRLLDARKWLRPRKHKSVLVLTLAVLTRNRRNQELIDNMHSLVRFLVIIITEKITVFAYQSDAVQLPPAVSAHACCPTLVKYSVNMRSNSWVIPNAAGHPRDSLQPARQRGAQGTALADARRNHQEGTPKIPNWHASNLTK